MPTAFTSFLLLIRWTAVGSLGSGLPKAHPLLLSVSVWAGLQDGGESRSYFVLLLLFHSLGRAGTFFQHAAEGVFRAACLADVLHHVLRGLAVAFGLDGRFAARAEMLHLQF